MLVGASSKAGCLALVLFFPHKYGTSLAALKVASPFELNGPSTKSKAWDPPTNPYHHATINFHIQPQNAQDTIHGLFNNFGDDH